MARHNDRYRIASIGQTHRTHCARITHPSRQLAITDGRAVGYCTQGLPHRELKRGADEIKLNIEVPQSAGKIRIELRAQVLEWLSIEAPLGGHQHWFLPVSLHIQTGDPAFAGKHQQTAHERTFKIAIANHGNILYV